MPQHLVPHTSSPSSSPSALLVGTDDMLLYTRKAILEKEGFHVFINSPLDAIRIVNNSEYNLIIACHTLGPAEADALVIAARSNPTHPALISFSKNPAPEHTGHPFDDSVWSFALPEAFISKVHEALRSRQH